MFLGEFVKELFQASRTRRSGVQPQLHRGMKYAAMRSASNVVLRDMNTSLIIFEMYRGANVIYCRLHRLRRDRPPLRSRTGRGAAGAGWHRRRDRHAGQSGRGRAAAVQVRRAVGPRPEPWRDLQAALRPEPGRGRAGPDGWTGNGLPDGDASRRLDVRELGAVGSDAQQRRQRNGRAGGVGQPHHRRRRRPGS